MRGTCAVVVLATIVLCLAGVAAPWSVAGWLALTSMASAAVAQLVSLPRLKTRLRGASVVLLVLLLGLRGVGALTPGPVRLLRLPKGSSGWVDWLFDEQDLSLCGARLLSFIAPRIVGDDREQVLAALRDAYAEMRREVGATPTPMLDTALSRQAPLAFDALVIEPLDPSAAANVGLVFLHGYGGSTTLECWLMARAAQSIRAVTVCPATRFSRRWGSDESAQIVRSSLAYLQARGIRRVYLAGMSNGAVGASALAPELSSNLAGLILVSGAPAAGDTGGLPTLVVQGAQDQMMSAAAARSFTKRTGATYVSLEGGHLVLLMRRSEARQAISDWLRRQPPSQ
jgi:pimeloyl-ACP methyl ester carboxylesterase